VADSVTGGKLTITAELPYPDGTAPPADADTPVILNVGSYTFQSKLGNDPDYRPGKSSARLTQVQEMDKGAIRTILATVQIRWRRQSHGESRVQYASSGKPIAAQHFIENTTGNFKEKRLPRCG